MIPSSTCISSWLKKTNAVLTPLGITEPVSFIGRGCDAFAESFESFAPLPAPFVNRLLDIWWI
eukprot:5509-Lingulodinium_polyedra.AAC.1